MNSFEHKSENIDEKETINHSEWIDILLDQELTPIGTEQMLVGLIVSKNFKFERYSAIFKALLMMYLGIEKFIPAYMLKICMLVDNRVAFDQMKALDINYDKNVIPAHIFELKPNEDLQPEIL